MEEDRSCSSRRETGDISLGAPSEKLSFASGERDKSVPVLQNCRATVLDADVCFLTMSRNSRPALLRLPRISGSGRGSGQSHRT